MAKTRALLLLPDDERQPKISKSENCDMNMKVHLEALMEIDLSKIAQQAPATHWVITSK